MADREPVINRARRRGRGRRQIVLGLVLIFYGLVGIGIFAMVATSIDRPLRQFGELSDAAEEQRAALIDSMERGEEALRQMGGAVGNMDTSLSDAKTATDRSSTIASGLAGSMFLLRDQMFITIPIIEAQPFVGLAPGFEQTGTQLQQLSTDLATIGTSLDRNRGDIASTAESLAELATSLSALTESVRTGPDLGVPEDALETFRLAILAVAGWVVLFAIGCVLAGLYLISHGWQIRRRRGMDEAVV
jgi:hypothetical protein